MLLIYNNIYTLSGVSGRALASILIGDIWKTEFASSRDVIGKAIGILTQAISRAGYLGLLLALGVP